MCFGSVMMTRNCILCVLDAWLLNLLLATYSNLGNVWTWCKEDWGLFVKKIQKHVFVIFFRVHVLFIAKLHHWLNFVCGGLLFICDKSEGKVMSLADDLVATRDRNPQKMKEDLNSILTTWLLAAVVGRESFLCKKFLVIITIMY